MSSGRPLKGEFAAYAESDIDYVEGDDAVEALGSQWTDVVALFLSLDEKSIRAKRYAPGKWTVKEVIGHLIDDERIFAYRRCASRAATRGPSLDSMRMTTSRPPTSSRERWRI